MLIIDNWCMRLKIKSKYKFSIVIIFLLFVLLVLGLGGYIYSSQYIAEQRAGTIEKFEQTIASKYDDFKKLHSELVAQEKLLYWLKNDKLIREARLTKNDLGATDIFIVYSLKDVNGHYYENNGDIDFFGRRTDFYVDNGQYCQAYEKFISGSNNTSSNGVWPNCHEFVVGNRANLIPIPEDGQDLTSGGVIIDINNLKNAGYSNN